MWAYGLQDLLPLQPTVCWTYVPVSSVWSPNRNCFVAGDIWPDTIQATASLLLSVRVMGTFFQFRRLKVPSRESNPSLLYECWCYHSIAGLNRLLACPVKFVLKFPEIAWNVRDFLSKFFFSRLFYSATPESFGSIISQNTVLEIRPYMQRSKSKFLVVLKWVRKNKYKIKG